MRQVYCPSASVPRNGQRKRILQQAPQRLHSPRRFARSGSGSCRRRLDWTNRLVLPLSCSATSVQSAMSALSSRTERDILSGSRTERQHRGREGRKGREGGDGDGGDTV